MKSSASLDAEGQPAANGFAEAVDWCSEITAVMTALSGVRLLQIKEDGLTLGLTTHAQTTWEHSPGEAPLKI
jgi:hypothetical protein